MNFSLKDDSLSHFFKAFALYLMVATVIAQKFTPIPPSDVPRFSGAVVQSFFYLKNLQQKVEGCLCGPPVIHSHFSKYLFSTILLLKKKVK